MVKRHLRRYEAPWWWPISVKEYTWVVRPNPGPHPLEKCLPLALLVRDVLRYAKTLREARWIIARGYIKVDGVPRKDYKYPVGLMDVIEIVPTGEVYRMVPHPVKYLWPVPIPKEEARYKLLRIENKTMVKGGQIQLNCHDGRNIQLPYEEGNKYSTLDVILFDLEKKKIVDVVRPELGVVGLIVDGRNVGRVGIIHEIITHWRRRKSTIAIRGFDGKEYRSILDYVFAVGREKPLITVTALEAVEAR